jgi:hypothetical protein
VGFVNLFWGFIFLFDFRLGGFDILPDFIGYIFIYSGLIRLTNINERFKTVKSISLLLVFLSIPEIYQISTTHLLGYFAGILLAAICLITTLLQIVLVYNICQGIIEMANERGNFQLLSKAKNRWLLYLVVNITIIAGTALPLILVVLFWPLIILSFISYILMLGLLKQAEETFA